MFKKLDIALGVIEVCEYYNLKKNKCMNTYHHCDMKRPCCLSCQICDICAQCCNFASYKVLEQDMKREKERAQLAYDYLYTRR